MITSSNWSVIDVVDVLFLYCTRIFRVMSGSCYILCSEKQGEKKIDLEMYICTSDHVIYNSLVLTNTEELRYIMTNSSTNGVGRRVSFN